MVRLKERLRKSLSEYSKFQFHYGTIKSRIAVTTISIIFNFNSTMVRLKESFAACCIAWREFQFHYGTIKSKSQREEVYASTPFQFHYGTIKSGNPAYRNRIANSISIPLWYD